MNKRNRHFEALGINKPTLVLDEKKAKKNVEKMVAKAKNAGVQLKPHFKTHQSREIGSWFKDLGVNKIAVSSLDMADYFAKAGWQDITVAFPVNILEIDKINSLAKSIKLNLLVDSISTIHFLKTQLKFPVRIWIKIDIGYGRVGVHWQEPSETYKIVKEILKTKKLNFAGLLSHFGQSYHATSADDLKQIYQESITNLKSVKSYLNKDGIQDIQISIGDTPCCSMENKFEDVGEIRPGNFIFYDLSQNFYGACQEEDIAVVVACPVVGKYEERSQIAIYGGAVHFSKDVLINEKGEKVFGYLTFSEGDQWTKIDKRGTLISVSQEHGILQVNDDLFNQIKIGDLVCILPVHSCLTANLYKEYLTLDGKRISLFQSFY